MILLSLPNPDQAKPILINANAFVSAKLVTPPPNSAKTKYKVKLSFAGEEPSALYEFDDNDHAKMMLEELGKLLVKAENSVLDLGALIRTHSGIALELTPTK